MSGSAEDSVTTVCLMGTATSDQQYRRVAELREGLLANGYRVRDCRFGLPHRGVREQGRVLALLTYLAGLFRAWLKIYRRFRAFDGVDVIVVPYPAHLDVFMARWLARGRGVPVVMDAFLRLHDTIVADRKLLPPSSYRARLVLGFEQRSLACADRILIDTPAQARSLVEVFPQLQGRIHALPLRIDADLWRCRRAPDSNEFRVLFWGTFIPLHGVETVVSAAALVAAHTPRIKFEVVGNGQTADQVQALINQLKPPNLDWTRKILPPDVIAAKAQQAHCVLGIFGGSEKAASVVPYKVYQGLAAGRVIVTRHGPAIEEILESGRSAVLVPPQNAQALADAVVSLSEHPGLARQIAERGQAVFEDRLSKSVADRVLGEVIESAIGRAVR